MDLTFGFHGVGLSTPHPHNSATFSITTLPSAPETRSETCHQPESLPFSPHASFFDEERKAWQFSWAVQSHVWLVA